MDSDGRFLFANSAFHRALKYVPQDLLGSSLLTLCEYEDRPILSAALTRAIASGINHE